jgi:glucosamine--fructose-6-phosphate aminotransferase (isomerizing)
MTSRMIEEIRQQPAALERTLKAERKNVEKLRKALESRRPRLIVLAARGTSDNAAQFARYLLEIETGIPVSLAAPSIQTLYARQVDLRETLVVAISQSGESTDTNFVLERAKEQGAFTVGITNESESALARLADFTLLVRAGKEQSVAATKTYTGQLLAVYLLAYALGARLPWDSLERLPDLAAKALALEPRVREIAPRFTFMNHAVVVGRGLNYSNAYELALKLMETCYVVAERFSSADLLHGPIAMVESQFPVFVFAAPGVTWPALEGLIGRLHELKAQVFVITDKRNKGAIALAGQGLELPLAFPKGEFEDVYTPIPYIIPGQLLAGHLAAEKGLNPDQPRALSKVTRTL